MTALLPAACVIAHADLRPKCRRGAEPAARENAVIPAKAGIHFFAVRQDGLGVDAPKVRPTKLGFPLSRE
jgi:hypothetical protein